MDTLASITEEIAQHLQKELDEPFKRLLGDKVSGWRSTLLRRTLKENPQERVHFRQALWIPMAATSAVPECIDPNAPVCDIMRSTVKIPKSVRAGGIVYDYVGAVDGNHGFKRSDPGMHWMLLHGKYSKKLITWNWVNGYLEVYNAIGLPLVRVVGVFENPEEVAAISCGAGGDCDFWNQPYPVSGDIKQAIVQSILVTDYGVKTTPGPANKEIQVTPQQQLHEPDGR